MAYVEERGESIRVSWRLGGSRTGARQSCTFTGASATARSKLAGAAKTLVESREHNIGRNEVYQAILGKPDDHGPVAPTFRHWVDVWLDERAKLRDVQPDVIRSYRRILKRRAVPFLGSYLLTEIDAETLKAWVAWLCASRITIGSKRRREGSRLLSAQTVRRAHAILHTCLAAAVPKWLTVNPAARPAGSARHVTGLPKATAFDAMYLTPAEVGLILEHCGDQCVRDLVFVAAHTGLRMGELFVLECADVVFSPDGATILVRRALKNDQSVGAPKSKASRRDVTVGEEVADLLRARVQGRRPRTLVFPSPGGGTWDEHNFRQRYFYPAVAAAMRCVDHPPPAPPKPARGVTRRLRVDEVSTCGCDTRLKRRPRFHDLRHTHVSWLIADKWHAKKIQVRVGHATYSITMDVYGHLMDAGNAGELASLEAKLSNKPVIQRCGTERSVPPPARRAVVQRRLSRRAATRRAAVS